MIVAGDGTSLWTLTRSIDFAVPFVKLFGKKAALGDDFQITSDRAFTWDQIHDAIARGFGVKAIHAHVPTDTLIRYHKAWEGPLMGDKSWSAVFDNSKIKKVAGKFEASQDLDKILKESVKHAKVRLKRPAPPESDEDRLMDRIIAEQAKLGSLGVSAISSVFEFEHARDRGRTILVRVSRCARSPTASIRTVVEDGTCR